MGFDQIIATIVGSWLVSWVAYRRKRALAIAISRGE